MEKLIGLSKREVDVIQQAFKKDEKALSAPALAKLKAMLRKHIENPLLSNEDRMRTEKQLASVETAERNLSTWKSKQARKQPSE